MKCHFWPLCFGFAFVAMMTGCSSIQEEYLKASEGNFWAARINVSRDVRAKNILIFAVVPLKSHVEKVGEYDVAVIYSKHIADVHVKNSGEYTNHHNDWVLNFAATQYAQGRKDVALRLMEMLAQAEPDLELSEPDIPDVPIKELLRGAKAGDSSTDAWILKEAHRLPAGEFSQ